VGFPQSFPPCSLTFTTTIQSLISAALYWNETDELSSCARRSGTMDICSSPVPIFSPAPMKPMPTKPMILSTQQVRGERELDITDIAPPPFDNPRGDADVVLGASDGVAFFLHTSTLRMSSVFFANILPLPSTPESTVGVARTVHGLPIIPVTESSRVLDFMLRAVVYPAVLPTITALEDAALFLRGAYKYQMPLVASAVQNSLEALCHAGHVLDVYAFACTSHLEQLAEYAAGMFCAVAPTVAGAEAVHAIHRIDEYTPAMDTIPAASYFRLLQCYQRVVLDVQRDGAIPRKTHFCSYISKALICLTCPKASNRV